ncbi:NDR1/HIN1-like protein 1 [Andrographis paniculata]|uniref:NDR1/HIN1-like protein 1 n=1 Tax=Andrographis paniculata TaxID=175694 RepID=UPI0021E8E119|nr:NDR1/HIN1-like protein 1 [Andrographis paniculata]
MSDDKVCSHHKNKRRKLLRRCCAGFLILAFLVLLAVLIIWAILQPKEPRFLLQDATVFNLNVSAPNVISTTIQLTISSRNPNSRIGIYYERLRVYANYNNQQITTPTGIPPVYQGHKDVNIWSPFIFGANVPVAPYNGLLLGQDKSNGGVNFKFKIDGRVKWKVGAFVSGRYHLHVTCPAFVPIGNSKNTGIVVGNAIKYQISRSCSVDV